mgnify:CR=1 FL=1
MLSNMINNITFYVSVTSKDIIYKVTIYDNTPILVAKPFANFNFVCLTSVNQRIAIS